MTTRVRAGGIAGDTITTSMMQNNIVTNAKMAADSVDSDVLANTITLSAGQLILPGSVIQYKKTHFNTQEGTTSTTFSDITGATQAFACHRANSLVKVSLILMCGGKGAINLVAGSTNLFQFNNSYAIYNAEAQAGYANGSTRDLRNISGFHSPGTTSSITYKAQMRAYSTGVANEFGVNELSNSSTYTYSYIECMEIAQ